MLHAIIRLRDRRREANENAIPRSERITLTQFREQTRSFSDSS